LGSVSGRAFGSRDHGHGRERPGPSDSRPIREHRGRQACAHHRRPSIRRRGARSDPRRCAGARPWRPIQRRPCGPIASRRPGGSRSGVWVPASVLERHVLCRRPCLRTRADRSHKACPAYHGYVIANFHRIDGIWRLYSTRANYSSPMTSLLAAVRGTLAAYRNKPARGDSSTPTRSPTRLRALTRMQLAIVRIRLRACCSTRAHRPTGVVGSWRRRVPLSRWRVAFPRRYAGPNFVRKSGPTAG
jgi:hypothetical protein